MTSNKNIFSKNEEDLTAVFKDMQISALTKAINISPDVKSITLGSNSVENNSSGLGFLQNIKKDIVPTMSFSSTPKKNVSQSLPSTVNLTINEDKKKIKKITNVPYEKSVKCDSNFSFQKLLNEFDFQRRLTVDKVMRERIQNMYESGKLIRDSLEHLHQARLEEAIAKRMLLESKIINDIKKLETLNKPKREAQLERENLKEAQRIHERNQKVKNAEEEARKKSEAILLKQKQIDQILFELQNEYNKEYKCLLETIKLCKDKAAITELTSSHSKVLKDCATVCEGLLKKCKQGDVLEEDVINAKKLVKTIKSIHEYFSKEIAKVHEANISKENKKTEIPQRVEDKNNVNKTNESSVGKEVMSHSTGMKPLQRHSNVIAYESPQISSQNNLPSILKRKFPKSIYYPMKKKAKNDNLSEEECDYEGTKKNRNCKVTSESNGYFKVKRNCMSTGANDFFEEGDIKRLKNANSVKKKVKRVRFSDCNDVIGSGFNHDTISNVKENVYDSKLIFKKQNIVNQESIFGDVSKSAQSNSNSILDLSDCYDARSFKLYTTLKTYLENFESTIQPLLADESMKKFRFNCQKAVTIPVNAISPVNAAHLTDKYMKLHHLLSGHAVDVGDIQVTATTHPLGISFCKNLLAKKLVRQGDLTVSSKQDAAFSIAAVVASLWVDFPDFGQLVLAHFYSACPYLVPVFMPQVEGQSDVEYHKALGYHYSSTGGVEKQDSFLKRMSGIMRLYAALIISRPRQCGKINPLGLSEGWRWISALLNLEPRPDICATLLYDFLEVAGNEMFKAYGVQFKKVLAYICQEYFPKLEKVTPTGAGGPIVRLEGFLQKVLKDEYIPPPSGILPPNFW